MNTKPEKGRKKQKRDLKSHAVNKDVWFYKNAKTIDFVVWTELQAGGRQCIQFRIHKTKLK